MLPLAKTLVPQMKMKLTFSASLIGRFSAAASYSSAPSLVEDKIWLMVPSQEAKDGLDTLIGEKTRKEVHKDQQEGKVGVHKWHHSCFYDLGKKCFITSNQQHNHDLDDDQEAPKIVGSSHGYLALLKPSDCSLSLIKIPPRFYAATRFNDEGHQLPGIDTLPPFTGKVFRQSEFNHRYGEYDVAGFASSHNVDGDEVTLETSKAVSDYFVEKIVMSSGDDLPTILMTTHSPSTKLVFCQGFGAKRWSSLHSDCCFSDVIYSTRDQKFYGIKNSYDLQIDTWDFKNRSPSLEKIAPHLCRPELNKLESYMMSKCQYRLRRYYLVESLGEILLVIRHFGFHVAEDGTCLDCMQDRKCELPYRTFDFDVFKLDRSGRKLHLVKCLGDQALFLGINQSFAVSAKQVPGIEGNSIYFGDHYMLNHSHFRGYKDYAFGGHDFGIFNVEEKSISACYPTQSMKLMQPPVEELISVLKKPAKVQLPIRAVPTHPATSCPNFLSILQFSIRCSVLYRTMAD